MTILESIILGLIQGVTEFLPVSSSGHLVLGNALFGLPADDITFEVFLHFATLLAVVIFFFRRILDIIISPCNYIFRGSRTPEDIEGSKYFLKIGIGTVPAVVVGLLLADYIEKAFASTSLVGITLLITTAILFLTLLARSVRTDIGFIDALVIGISQAGAILPGISRSGSTISTAMYLGIDKKSAFDFSFLLSLPAILAAFVYKLIRALEISSEITQFAVYLPGVAAAFVSGYVCLIALRKIVIAGRFAYFGIYTLIIGILTLIFSHG